MNYGYLSDRGKERGVNEDTVLVLAFESMGASLNAAYLLVVADGVGGLNAGEIASSLSARSLASKIAPLLVGGAFRGVAGLDVLRESLCEVNDILIDHSKKDPSCAGMASTLTCAVVVDKDVFFGHIGDSRAYVLSKDLLEQVSTDHTEAQSLVSRGELAPEDVKNHPGRAILTRALGLFHGIEIDVCHRTIGEGDIVLLCTDGLTARLEDEGIKGIIEANTPDDACFELVCKANEAGGQDNVSVIVYKKAVGRTMSGQPFIMDVTDKPVEDIRDYIIKLK